MNLLKSNIFCCYSLTFPARSFIFEVVNPMANAMEWKVGEKSTMYEHFYKEVVATAC